MPPTQCDHAFFSFELQMLSYRLSNFFYIKFRPVNLRENFMARLTLTTKGKSCLQLMANLWFLHFYDNEHVPAGP